MAQRWDIEKDLTKINNKSDLIKHLDIEGETGHIFNDHVDVAPDKLMTMAVANSKLNGNSSINGNKEHTGRGLMLSYIKNVIVNNQDQINQWLEMKRPRIQNPENDEKYKILKVSKRYKHTGQSVNFNTDTMEFEFRDTDEITVALRRSSRSEHPFGFRVYTAYPSHPHGEPTFTKSAETFFDEHPEFSQSKKIAYIMANKYKNSDDIRVRYSPNKDSCIFSSDKPGYTMEAELKNELTPKFYVKIEGKGIDITSGEKLKGLFEDKKDRQIPNSLKTADTINDLKSFKAEIGCKFNKTEPLIRNEDLTYLNKNPATKRQEMELKKFNPPGANKISHTQKMG